MPATRVAISATFTAEPLREPLEFFFRLLGWDATVEFAPFAQVYQTLLDPAGLFAQNREGFNIVLLRAEDLPDVDELARALQTASAHQTFPILVRICPPRSAAVEDRLTGLAHVRLLTEDAQARLYPVGEVLDQRSHKLGAIPFTAEYFAALGAGLAREIHRLRMRPFKVIALDCDDTLWSGICGEDGPLGVLIDEPRRALQEFMAAQHASGKLLTLASKNNPEDVAETFRQHPEMPLRLEDFVAQRVNWESKFASLSAIADELNLGLDSFIFIDDNPKECEEASAELPQMVSLALPADPAEIPAFLAHVWAFDVADAATAEDRQRHAAYVQQAARTHWERQTHSLEEFLAGLRLEIEIAPLAAHQIARAAQLTQRTSQMNFASRRRTEAEIGELLASGNCFVTTVRDRFGDYGLVGLSIFEEAGEALGVDTFLLSCRALGRGVEHRMLRHAGEVALSRGLPTVSARCEPTLRNKPAQEFLTSVPSFAAADLAQLSYRPGKQRPFVAADSERTTQGGGVPEYGRIARDLRLPAQIVAAMRQEKLRRATPRPVSEPPRTDLERQLAALWTELLGVPAIGVHDNFFDMGGHSLLAVQLVSRLHRDLAIDLPLEAVYTGTLTIVELARSIEIFQLGRLDDEQYAALLAEVEHLSEEEAEALLERELGR